MSIAKLVLQVDDQVMQEFDLDAERVAMAHAVLERYLELTIYLSDARAVGWLMQMLTAIRKVWSQTT